MIVGAVWARAKPVVRASHRIAEIRTGFCRAWFIFINSVTPYLYCTGPFSAITFQLSFFCLSSKIPRLDGNSIKFIQYAIKSANRGMGGCQWGTKKAL